MTDQSLTLELQGPEHLIAHIQGLQATLTQRNATIEKLRQDLGLAESGEPNEKALNKAYKRGWEDCALRLENVTRDAAVSLGRIRKNALDIYYEGERTA